MIKLEFHKQIPLISLNRPKKANAYTQDMLAEFQRIWTDIEGQYSVVIISSEGNSAFCAGADLNEMNHKRAEDALDLHSQKLFEEIASSPMLSIAAIQGPAIAGGCELALACDLRVSSLKAYFALPEVSLGLLPSAGGCTRLTNLLGSSIAKAVILGGEHISAQQALDWGLVHRCSDTPKQEALQWAQQIAGSDPLALRLAKSVLQDPSLGKERLAEALLYERRSLRK